MSEASSAESPLHAELRRLMPGMPPGDVPRFAAALMAPPPAPGAPAAPAPAYIPQGLVTSLRHVGQGPAYPGVARAVHVYRPAGSAAAGPAALMVFQDGARYLGPEANAPAVFDQLIAAGAIPPTIGVFVEPGETGPGLPIYGGSGNRSVEYDTLGPTYANFLIDELLPDVTRRIALIDDPAARAICGLSSGGICAFNAAWERPDFFSKVVSHCGSFVDIRGGHGLAPAVRRAPRKPLRVFLQTGEQDLDIVFGNWLLGNRELASALAYRGYEHQLVVGSGGHSLAHGGAMLADTLRWLWRDQVRRDD